MTDLNRVDSLLGSLREAVGDKKPAYIGVFLAKASQGELLHAVPPKHAKVAADHVTVIFKPTPEDLANYAPKLGTSIQITATHEVSNDKVQAVKVTGVPAGNREPHITISHGEGVSPVESNKILHEPGRQLTPPIKLEAVWDTWPRTV